MVEAHNCVDDSSQQEFMGKEESVSPMVLAKSIFLAAIIKAKEEWDVVTANILNNLCKPMPTSTQMMIASL